MSTILNSKAGKATPAQKSDDMFFPQHLVGLSKFNPQETVVTTIPGSGIPMRDYFAAHAVNTGGAVSFDSSRELAEWAYRVADAMIEARRQKDDGVSPDGMKKDSQFIPE